MVSKKPPLVIWRYIGFEVLAIFVVSLAIQTFISVMAITFQLVQHKGLSLTVVWPFLIQVSILCMYYTIPISLLFSVTLGFGRMVSDREVIALKANGLSYLQIMTPALLIGAGFVGISHYINGELVPVVHYQRDNLKRRALRQLADLGTGRNRTIRLPDEMGTIQCGSFNHNVLEDVFISITNLGELTGGSGGSSSQELPVLISARRAEIKVSETGDNEERLEIEFRNAKVNIPDNVLRQHAGDPHFLHRIDIDSYLLPIALSESSKGKKDTKTSALKDLLKSHLAALRESKKDYQKEKNVEAQAALRKRINWYSHQIHEIRAELWRRDAFAFSCLAFLWAAVPLTFWLNNKNRLVPFFAGNLLAIGVFFPLVTLGKMLAEKGFPPAVALEGGNLVLLLVGCTILWRLRKT